jgi:hypothetical protein
MRPNENLKRQLKISISWNDIFRIFGPKLISTVQRHFAKSEFVNALKEHRKLRGGVEMRSEDFETIGFHLMDLGLVKIFSASAVKNTVDTFWSITERGLIYLSSLKAMRSDSGNT